MSLFKEESTNTSLQEQGFAIIKHVFDKPKFNEFMQESYAYIDTLESSTKNGFTTLTKGKEKEGSQKIIKQYFIPVIQDLVNDNAEILSGVHLLKSRGFGGKLGLHQDSAIVDESKFRSYAIWMPLVDTDLMGGALTIVPGSHLIGNHFRSPVLKNPLESEIRKLNRFEQTLPVKAGELIIFDNAMFHGSKINMRYKLRLAVNAVVKPKSASLVYYYPKDGSEAIEIYNVEHDFYEESNIYEAPPQSQLLRTVKCMKNTIDYDILEEHKTKFKYI